MTRSHDDNIRQDVRNVLHPYTPLDKIAVTGPMVIRKGDGVYVEDDQGRRYLEGMSGLWCTALGFSEQRLVDAAIRQMRDLPYYQIFAGRSNEPSIELSARLLDMTRHLGMDKALFGKAQGRAPQAGHAFQISIALVVLDIDAVALADHHRAGDRDLVERRVGVQDVANVLADVLVVGAGHLRAPMAGRRGRATASENPQATAYSRNARSRW